MHDHIAAELAIRRLHALCADAVYRKDGHAFAACYTPDGEWKIAGLHIVGRAAIANALGELGAANERIFMTFGAPILEFGSQTVAGRTYVTEHVKRHDGSAAVTLGIYYEKFVFSDGQWRFQWRHFDFLYFGPPDLSDPFYPLNDYGAPPATPPADAPTAGLCI